MPPIIYEEKAIRVKYFLHIVTIFYKKKGPSERSWNDGPLSDIIPLLELAGNGFTLSVYNHLYVQPFGSRFFWFYCYLIYQSAVWLKNIIVRRECWGTDSNPNIVYQVFYKYEHLSRWAGLWNCPTPYLLVVNRISLDSYPAKLVNTSALRE